MVTDLLGYKWSAQALHTSITRLLLCALLKDICSFVMYYKTIVWLMFHLAVRSSTGKPFSPTSFNQTSNGFENYVYFVNWYLY